MHCEVASFDEDTLVVKIFEIPNTPKPDDVLKAGPTRMPHAPRLFCTWTLSHTGDSLMKVRVEVAYAPPVPSTGDTERFIGERSESSADWLGQPDCRNTKFSVWAQQMMW